VSGEPSLTFAIPFYRNVEYLRRAIDSVLTQTDDRWLVFVADDAGPEPEAADLVRSYAHDRITYTRNAENLGLAGNWNHCVERATTELVTLLHADDELLPGYAKVVIAAHEEFPDTIAVYPRAQVIDAEGRRAFSAPDFAKRVIEQRSHRVVLQGEVGLQRLMRGQTLFCPSLCYRRSLMGPAPFSSKWSQVLDLEFFSRALLEGQQFVGLREVAYAYRRHAASQTANLTENLQRFREELTLFDVVARRADALEWSRAARTSRHKAIVRLHLAFRAVEDLFHGRAHAAASKFGLMRP
jgi:glycosyltransferase involved in cell wall biosynthesis